MPRPIGHRPPAAAPGLLDPVMLAPPVLDHRGIAPVADDVGYLPVGEALVDTGLDPSLVGELGMGDGPGHYIASHATIATMAIANMMDHHRIISSPPRPSRR